MIRSISYEGVNRMIRFNSYQRNTITGSRIINIRVIGRDFIWFVYLLVIILVWFIRIGWKLGRVLFLRY
jgi:hypothetical protein